MEITLTQNNIQDIKKIISKKEELEKELKKIDNYLRIYKKEIKQMENIMHRTKTGDLMLVSEMENDHLLNTINFMLKRGFRIDDKSIQKYIDEVKKRNLVDKVLEMTTETENKLLIETEHDFIDNEDMDFE